MNKEEIYDAQIAPLMAQIIDVCKANKIAMLATFHLPIDEDDNLECTTALLGDDFDPPEQMIAALNVLRPPQSRALMIRTLDAQGNVISMETIVP